jgi:hypothetical protein
LAGVEAADLAAVATGFHVAPAAGVILAGVEEDPAAGVAGAAAEAEDVVGGEEIVGGLGEEPEGGGEAAAEAFPEPEELAVLGLESSVKGGLLEEVFEEGDGLGCRGGLGVVEPCVGEGGEGFAELDGLLEDGGWIGLGVGVGTGCVGVGGEAFELAGLAVGQEAGLVGEAEEVVVSEETFLRARRRAGEAVVEGVDEVEGGVAGEEFEGFGGGAGFGRHVA